MAERPPFPAAIDSTMLKTFRGCPRRAELEYFHHWKSKLPSVHLHAGAAFAEGLEAARRAFYEQGRPHEECVGLGIETLLYKLRPSSASHVLIQPTIRLQGCILFNSQ